MLREQAQARASGAALGAPGPQAKLPRSRARGTRVQQQGARRRARRSLHAMETCGANTHPVGERTKKKKKTTKERMKERQKRVLTTENREISLVQWS